MFCLDWLLGKFHRHLCFLDCILSKAQEGALSGMEINYCCVASEFKYLTQKGRYFTKCNDLFAYQQNSSPQKIQKIVHTG